VPVIAICTPKEVIDVVLEDTASVMIAGVDCPGDSAAPCVFHVIDSGPFAVVGFQLVVVIESATVAVPCVFLM
jgi:hypothetical protein